MPGQRNTATQESASLMSFYVYETLIANTVQYVPLFYCEKDTVLDAAFIRQEALDASNASRTATINYAASGTAFSSSTAITSTLGVGSTSGSGTNNTTREFSLVTSAGVPTQNVVRGQYYNSANTLVRGGTILLAFDGAPAATLTPVLVTLRLSHFRH